MSERRGDATSEVELIIRSEREWIEERRSRFAEGEAGYGEAQAATGAQRPLDRNQGTCGLALSGGGIRSATFSLGFLQGLSARGLVPHIDYLSTVSGGTYIGAFVGALFVPPNLRGDGIPPSDPAIHPFDAKDPLGSKRGVEAIKQLRESGRYLSPAGTSDAFYGGTVVLRNWAALQVAMGLVALLGFGLLYFLDAPAQSFARWVWPEIPIAEGVSATLVVVLGLTLSLALASGAAYWCTRRDSIPASRAWRIATSPVVWVLVAAAAYAVLKMGAVAAQSTAPSTSDAPPVAGFVAWTALSAIAFFVGAELRHGELDRAPAGASASTPAADRMQRLSSLEDAVRASLSRGMSRMLKWSLAALFLLVVIFAGFEAKRMAGTLLKSLHSGSAPDLMDVTTILRLLPAALPPLLSFIVNLLLKGAKSARDAREKENWITNHAPAFLAVSGILLLATWMVLWSSISHALFNGSDSDGENVIIIALILVNLAIGVSYSFINLSSLSTFYAGRLRRAYIGASSQGRRFSDSKKDLSQDTIMMENYYEGMKENLGPIHLINVTIAETAGASNIVARDRKGKPMILSPFGLIYQDEKPGEFRVRGHDEGERLPLANWVAISGAAMAAAIGSGTSLGTSILATMTNVRLGYWWKHRRGRRWRGHSRENVADSVQNYLFKELRGAFDGTRGTRWYLTDGGHFDNTAIFALLQRRVSLIIACDNGADPKYRMEDLVRLVGRARTDLDVGITFLSDAQIIAKLSSEPNPTELLGAYDRLARTGSPTEPGGPIAAVAEIVYGSGESRGLLLVVKPRLTFREPPDLLAYRSKAGGNEFPQQTTADQFFDEEQWEAYRQLGELAARKLFPASASGTAPLGPIGALLRSTA